ncbi:MAG: class I SAM-dependent methyltransferase [Thermoleophilia bacterium]|nr:class I SAM-dependent methyltransferase [Thermoleophilia bacterium]
MDLTHPLQSTNFEKFQTGNPVVRHLIDRFYARVGAIVGPLGANSLLDAGCGEGETLDRLGDALPTDVAAIDISADAVRFAAARFPAVSVRTASIGALPFADDSFELVICLEVLEHVADPAAALTDLARVGSRDLVISVPDEPWFRLGSLLRGKYLRELGDHPEHVNHWNPKSLGALLSDQLELISLDRSLPWLIAHCRLRR